MHAGVHCAASLWLRIGYSGSVFTLLFESEPAGLQMLVCLQVFIIVCT